MANKTNPAVLKELKEVNRVLRTLVPDKEKLDTDSFNNSVFIGLGVLLATLQALMMWMTLDPNSAQLARYGIIVTGFSIVVVGVLPLGRQIGLSMRKR